MKKVLKNATLILTVWLTAASLMLQAESQVPTIPMTIDGYVLVKKVDGTNRTAPAGFAVYAKEGATVINVEDPQNRWITNASGYYMLGASASADNVPIDMWVENINVTRITFRQGTFLTLNLTVVDTTPPTIEILSPQPQQVFAPNQRVWVNATLTDNFAVDTATITMTLNQTQVTPTYNPANGLLSYQTDPLTTIGLYIVSVAVEDLAGNTATTTWNFTVTITPPTISIVNPTTANPKYTQSGKTIQVTYQYTEPNPKNVTVRIYNTTHTIATATITDLTGGTDIQRTDNIDIPTTAAEGGYHLDVVIYSIYELSATATQTNAIKVDETAPSISNPYQNPPGQVMTPGVTVEIDVGQNVTVQVNVTDAASPIKEVVLFYNTTATTWANIAMQLKTGNQYEATIPSSHLEACTTVLYYVTATDAADNTAQTPTVGVYFQYHVIPEYMEKTALALLLLTIAAIVTAKRKTKKA